MTRVRPSPLPADALLQGHRANGAFTDCYTTDVAGSVSHAAFVTAFYTSPLFKVERLILRWVCAKPSTDAQAAQLAAATIQEFAVWQLEGLAPNQHLLADSSGRTRSWLMTEPIAAASGVSTRLYFGSAVISIRNARTGTSSMGWGFRALLGFHALYSRLLLRAAAASLRTAARRSNRP